MAKDSRTPHGVRGLKRVARHDAAHVGAGRTPHGVRGLKPPALRRDHGPRGSHPARGAWIETPSTCTAPRCPRVAPRKGCVD